MQEPMDVKGNPSLKAAHAMGRPKCPEQPKQCVSCPFRKGNDEEFGKIVIKLRELEKQKPVGGRPSRVPLKRQIAQTRFQIYAEATRFIDFACHQTVYKPDMTMRPRSEHRQCPGATKVFKGED